METSERFHDLLFEISNENRFEVLKILRIESKRIIDLTRETKLTTTEVRRHVSRLADVGLIQRDVEGFYHLTPYGETVLLLLQEYNFLSSNSEYFQTHILSKIPNRFVKQIGELTESKKTKNVMDFLLHTENLFKESNEYVWLLVDQFPLNSLSTITEAIERGVQFKIIEPRDRVLSPDIASMASEETQIFSRARYTPLVEYRMLDEVNVFLFLSESRCVIAFPTADGQYDYTGFTASDDSSLKWCKKLFQRFWDEGVIRTSSPPSERVDQERVSSRGGRKKIVVEGRNDPNIDTQSLQDAVDNFDEVILRGRFNLQGARMRTHSGKTSIQIRRSVVLRGEGRVDNVPSTKIVKCNWQFPLLEYDNLIDVNGEGIDVTIENLHFQDFNSYCIDASQGNSVEIRNNRITLTSGLGRGTTYGDMGDQVAGITISSSLYPEGSFPGGVIIEGNYLDFATNYSLGGYVSRKKVLDPNYRPDHINHESYLGFGILGSCIVRKAIIKDNIVRNMNARGIVFQDSYESAEIQITGNTIVSEIFGSYPFSTHFAGFGIQVLGAWSTPLSGARVEISGNEIKCDKLNYCGIAVYGPSMYKEGAGKLGECVVRDNDIHLGDGSVGVLIRKNDETEVVGNKISGKAYYGFHLSGSKDREGFDLGSNHNLIEDNDMTDLVIKASDKYSDSHVDGRMFTGSEGKSTTGHVWLNEYSGMNVVKIQADETVIDEGKNNTIERS
jgi:predicted transcriptional regulator